MTTEQYLQDLIESNVELIANYANSSNIADILAYELAQRELKHQIEALTAVRLIEELKTQ